MSNIFTTMGYSGDVTIDNVSDDVVTIDALKYTIDIANGPTILGGAYNTTSSWGNGASGTINGNYYGTTNYTFTNSTTGPLTKKGLSVTGDSAFEGDITVKGISIVKSIEEINKRLAILVPDPAKLEKFEALKRAYDNYKTLEALCELPIENE